MLDALSELSPLSLTSIGTKTCRPFIAFYSWYPLVEDEMFNAKYKPKGIILLKKHLRSKQTGAYRPESVILYNLRKLEKEVYIVGFVTFKIIYR